MPNQGREAGFPRGRANSGSPSQARSRRAPASTDWLRSLRAKRAFDGLGASGNPVRSRVTDNEPTLRIERPPAFVKAAPIDLPTPCTTEDALIATVGNCLTHLSGNEECALSGGDPEGVHQMRVALRRLDATLTLYRPVIPREQTDHLQRMIKGVAQSLGPARDWDVFIADILDPVAANMPNDPDLKFLRTIALRQRIAAYKDVQRMLRSTSYRDLWGDISGWLNERAWRQQPVSEKSLRLMSDIHAFSEAVLEKAHSKLLKRGKGFAVLDARERHKLRIRVKKVRYAVEFLGPTYGTGARDYLTALRGLQDDLGRANDVESARGLLDGIENTNAERARRIARAGGLVIGWHRNAAAQREDNLVRHWRKLKKIAPFWRQEP